MPKKESKSLEFLEEELIEVARKFLREAERTEELLKETNEQLEQTEAVIRQLL